MATIEQNLERIATALETIAKNGGSLSVVHNQVGEVSETKVDVKAGEDAAAKAAADKKAAEAAAAKKAAADKKAAEEAAAKKAADAAAASAATGDGKTIDDVRAALKAYREIEGAAAMLDVLKEFGAENLQALKPEHFAAVIAKVS